MEIRKYTMLIGAILLVIGLISCSGVDFSSVTVSSSKHITFSSKKDDKLTLNLSQKEENSYHLSLYKNGSFYESIGIPYFDILCFYYNDTLKLHTSEVPTNFNVDLSNLTFGKTDSLKFILFGKDSAMAHYQETMLIKLNLEE